MVTMLELLFFSRKCRTLNTTSALSCLRNPSYPGMQRLYEYIIYVFSKWFWTIAV